jgi:hypothetical protein
MFNQFNVEKKWYTYTDKITSVSGELLIDNNVDICGNLNIKSGLVINNNYGSDGQILVSKGYNASPTWQSGASLKSTHFITNNIAIGNIQSEAGTLVGYHVSNPYNFGIRGPYGWSIYTKGFNGPEAVQHIRFTCSESGSGASRQFHPYTYLAGTASAQYAFTVSSDDRLKHNEVIIDNGLEIMRELKPQFYQKTRDLKDENYNGDLSGQWWCYEAGLIAQDIAKIPDLSYCVTGGDYINPETGENVKSPYTVKYNDIFVYALSAIKELDAKVQELTARLDQLR